MLEKLILFDQQLFRSLNGSGPDFLDTFMKVASATWIWFPVVALIVFLFLRLDLKKGLLMTLFLLLTIVLTEQISVQVFKEGFQRLRPCHDESLFNDIRLVAGNCGGLYGFVSTHATNAAGLVFFSSLIIRKKWFTSTMIGWGLIVSYSRIHLGVHFPGDVAGGILLGLIIGFITFVLLQKVLKSQRINEQPN